MCCSASKRLFRFMLYMDGHEDSASWHARINFDDPMFSTAMSMVSRQISSFCWKVSSEPGGVDKKMDSL